MNTKDEARFMSCVSITCMMVENNQLVCSVQCEKTEES
jgi:hypothetical protein